MSKKNNKSFPKVQEFVKTYLLSIFLCVFWFDQCPYREILIVIFVIKGLNVALRETRLKVEAKRTHSSFFPRLGST